MMQDSKKVLFVSPTGGMHGGAERSGLEFCKYLVRSGYFVDTVLPKDDNSDYIQILESLEMAYHTADYSFDGINDSFKLGSGVSKEVFGLVDIINDVKPSLIVSNMSSFVHGALAASITNTPHIWMERGNGYRMDQDNIKEILDFVFEYSNGVIVNSSGLSDIYKNHYKVKTTVVRSFTKKPSYGLGSGVDERRIVVVSRMSPEKNIKEILEAVSILNANNPKHAIRTVIMGKDYGSAAALRDFISKHDGMAECVDILDYEDEPWKKFGPGDIYVNSSLYESVGRSSIEAIKLGLPVILADIPGHSDIFNLVGGYKYRLGSPEDLADKIDYVLKNTDSVSNDTKKWSLLAEDKFSEESCYGDVLEFIDKIIPENNPVMASKVMNNIIDSVLAPSFTSELSGLDCNPGILRSARYLQNAIILKIKKIIASFFK